MTHKRSIVISVVMLINNLTSVICSECEPDFLFPCSINNHAIYCGPTQEPFDLVQLFQNMSECLSEDQKHFTSFKLRNQFVTEFSEDTFKDITFAQIDIQDAYNFARIHSRAFSRQTAIDLIDLFIHPENNLQNFPPDYDFIEAIASAPNLKNVILEFGANKTLIIPSHAFQNQVNGNISTYNELDFVGTENTTLILSDYSFNELPKPLLMFFRQIRINYIPAHAFDFRPSNAIKTTITFDDTNLNASSFEVGAFLNTNGPTELDFLNNKIDSLNEDAFKPFLLADSRNHIYFLGNDNIPFLCDCSLYWILEQKSGPIRTQIYGATCSNGTSIWDIDINNLSYCKSDNTSTTVQTTSTSNTPQFTSTSTEASTTASTQSSITASTQSSTTASTQSSTTTSTQSSTAPSTPSQESTVTPSISTPPYDPADNYNNINSNLILILISLCLSLI